MPPDNNQTAQRSVHGNQIPSIGRVETPFLLAGTPDMGYALRGTTESTTAALLYLSDGDSAQHGSSN
jgi:hypothetical protein